MALKLRAPTVAQQCPQGAASGALEGDAVDLFGLQPLGIAGIPLVAVIPAHGIDLGQLTNSALNVKGVGIGECLGLALWAHRGILRRCSGGGSLAAACSNAEPMLIRSGPSIKIWARVLVSRNTSP